MTSAFSPPDRELIVRVSIGFDLAGVDAFTPGRSMRIGRCRFEVNPPDERPCDYWIVFGNTRSMETARVAPRNTLLIVGEPPAKKLYPHRYYNQFAHVIDTHDHSAHPGLVIAAPCLFWMVGLSYDQSRYTFGYDELKELGMPEKSNRVSVVCSNTAKTAGQRRRLVFLQQLKDRLGERIIHYGKGFAPVDDKMEAILPHRFHLSLENSQSPHYWTEKIADAYLGWAFPFYVGCPNIGDYFAAESYRAIDMADVEGAVATITGMLDTPPGPAETAALREARERVLERYNPFMRFQPWVEKHHLPDEPTLVTIRSHKSCKPMIGWLHRLRKS